MRTHDLTPDDEIAVRSLLTTAEHAGPQSSRPPELDLIRARARRLGRVRRMQAVAVVAAAVMIAGGVASVLPYGHGSTTPAAESRETTMVVMSSTMEPALSAGDLLRIDTTVRTAERLRHGDIIVFEDPGGWLASSYSGQPPWLVRRVIGMPGDRVACCDRAGRLTVNGKALTEPYVAAGDRPSNSSFTTTVRPDHFWVMGDHRSESVDSRFHRDADDGQIPQSRVIGRVSSVTEHHSVREKPLTAVVDTAPGEKR
jgi:signal peptidase I